MSLSFLNAAIDRVKMTVLVTRTHRVASASVAGLDKISAFVEKGISYTDAIYICVR